MIFQRKGASCWQAVSEETRKLRKMEGILRRICLPKPASGKLDVHPDVYKQFRAGGAQRQTLLNTLIQVDGKKASVVFH